MALHSSCSAGVTLLVWKKEELSRTDVPFDLMLSKMG